MNSSKWPDRAAINTQTKMDENGTVRERENRGKVTMVDRLGEKEGSLR